MLNSRYQLANGYSVLAESVETVGRFNPLVQGATDGNIAAPVIAGFLAGISDRRTVGSLRETIISASVAAIAATTFQIVTGQTDCVRNIVL